MRIGRDGLLAAIVLLMVIAIGFVTPSFDTAPNLVDLFNDTAILIMMALAQMTVILTKCIDLSVAANVALTGVLIALLNVAFPGLPVPVLMVVAAGIGLLLGAFNGAMVWLVGIPSIVVTLGTLSIYRGLSFLASGGTSINGGKMSPAFIAVPRAIILGLPVMSWFAIAAVAIFLVFLRFTRTGRAFFAAGGNPTAAVYTGIDVGRSQFIAFCISGAVAGFCGYLWVSRYTIAYVDIAGGFELQVIAACVIGGVSISGGIGTVAGAVLGALFLGVVKNALPVIHISPFWQLAISGIAILGAVIINAGRERRVGRLILKEAAA
ncbi:MAG TPA: ABC transporter permease [Bauldia sp.]|jgi:rhamnose transport system permease protein